MPAAASASILAELPSELILESFAFGASASIKTALALSLVSSDVKRFTARYLYATVILRSARQIAAFLALLTAEHAEADSEATHVTVNPAPYVRNLCITHHAPGAGRASWVCGADGVLRDPYATIFERCAHVRRAALQSTFLHSSLVPDHPVHKLRCREILILGPTFPSDWEKHASAALAGGADADAIQAPGGGTQETADAVSQTAGGEAQSSSVLKHTTHLRLLESLSSPHFSGAHLAALPRLTHVALLVRQHARASDPFADVAALLASPQLRMVVVGVDFRRGTNHAQRVRALDEWAHCARARDARLFVVERDEGEPLHRWVDSVGCGEDIWTRALREHKEREVRRGAGRAAAREICMQC